MDRSRQRNNILTSNPPAIILIDSRFVTVIDWNNIEMNSIIDKNNRNQDIEDINNNIQ